MGHLWGTPPSYAYGGRYADDLPQEVRDHLAVYGYGTLRDQIRSRRIYEECAAMGWPVSPTSDELEALRLSPDERHVLAGETLLAFLKDPDKTWPSWDPHKGAAMETYFVGGLIKHFPTVFRRWQRTRQNLPLPLAPGAAALSGRGAQADPALGVVARDELERALRAAEPEIRAVLGLVAAGYRHSEIADRLRISERAVEGRIYRFRRSVRNS